MTKKEAHSTIKIPPMEYFKLDRAASILQCDTDDLLHYGVIGAIPLCIMMRGFSSTLAFIGGKDIKDPIEFYHEHKGNSSFLFREGNYISHFNSLLTEYDVYRTDSGIILFNGMAHGLWCVGYSEIESLLYYGEAKLTDATPFRPFGCDIFLEKTGVSCHIVSKKYFDLNWLPLLNRKLAEKIKFNSSINRNPETEITITSSDIFIARDTILKLKDAIDTGEPMKSMINGGVAPSSPTEENVGKPVKITEKQTRLIVALLKSAGLTDSDLKGSIQQLRNKANNKVEGLPLPDDDKTLIDWLRKGGINR
ncbi:TPA: hypothetical protein ACSRGI_000864 [Klebsiella variicola subsp. variicola]|uniref:hypothetical protein n=1 Tax=Klebsiella variicola TaxID=244366 RepID=UPI002556BAA3|nr:hypothetical protein [Klebsiella variicola]MEC6018934.1 hypothetical protein [Klebsiella variicola]HBS6100851.1 hypothetical protein [Klebsiella variicola]